jgi:hypothetical protein
VKLGRVVIERKSADEVKAAKQAAINTIRRGGFKKQADRAQRKLDRSGTSDFELE